MSESCPLAGALESDSNAVRFGSTETRLRHCAAAPHPRSWSMAIRARKSTDSSALNAIFSIVSVEHW